MHARALISWVVAIWTLLLFSACGGGGSGGGVPPAAGSAPGDFVAFGSAASNMVAGDANGMMDVFVHNRTTGATARVSVDSAGGEANDQSSGPALSADGRFVAFDSSATNLAAGDTNGVRDIFIHDRSTGITSRCCVSGKGAENGNGSSLNAAISGDGSIFAFESSATNLAGNDTNLASDIFAFYGDTKELTRVSVDSAGNEGNGNSFVPALSADGRFVFYESASSNLVANDTNGVSDIFRYDRLNPGSVLRVSVRTFTPSVPSAANGHSTQPAVPADGNCLVAFTSQATNLAVDFNSSTDIFVHDSCLGITTRVSVDSTGNEANAGSLAPAFSADGRLVAFQSFASNLVANDMNGAVDIFVHDRTTGATTRVSVDSAGGESNGGSFGPALSADGRFVSFHSLATNLVAGDTNAQQDIFVHDRSTGVTTRVSVNSAGVEGNGSSMSAAML